MVSHVGRDRPAAELNANPIDVRGQRASHGVARCITRHPQFDDEVSGSMFGRPDAFCARKCLDCLEWGVCSRKFRSYGQRGPGVPDGVSALCCRMREVGH